MRKVTTIFFLSLLSACSVGPDYTPPEIDVPESFGSGPETGFSKLDVEAHWWQGFEDELLPDLIARAIVGNKDLKQAVARINQSRALAREAFTELLPGALLQGSYQKAQSTNARFPEGNEENGGNSSGGFSYEIYTAGIDASWELDLFGRLRRELEGRNAEYTASVALLEDGIRSLLSEVAQSYFELRGTQSLLDIANKNVALQTESLELIKTKFEFGEVGELDLARAKTQLAQTQARIPALEAATKVGAHRIAVLLGEQPKALYAMLLPSKPLPVFTGPLTIGKPEMLLRRRPDVRAAERTLAAETARIGVAVGELFPKITITGSLGYEAPKISSFDSNAETYSFGPSISWAAFDTGRLRARINVAKARTEEALRGYEGTVLVALEDVENALTRYATEKRRVVSFDEAFRASRRAYSIAQTQYREGVLDFLPVLDAQRTLLQSESDLLQSKQDLSTALVSIYKALGGGWEGWKLEEEA